MRAPKITELWAVVPFALSFRLSKDNFHATKSFLTRNFLACEFEGPDAGVLLVHLRADTVDYLRSLWLLVIITYRSRYRMLVIRAMTTTNINPAIIRISK